MTRKAAQLLAGVKIPFLTKDMVSDGPRETRAWWLTMIPPSRPPENSTSSESVKANDETTLVCPPVSVCLIEPIACRIVNRLMLPV